MFYGIGKKLDQMFFVNWFENFLRYFVPLFYAIIEKDYIINRECLIIIIFSLCSEKNHG